MLALAADHDDRKEALRDAFDHLATDLLYEREPDDEASGLLLLVITDAALSGDRTILAAAEEAIGRLNSYLEGTAVWSDELRGRFWTLGHLAGLSEFLLTEEERLADSPFTA